MTAAGRKKAVPSGIATRHGTVLIFETDHPISTALERYGEWAQAEVETLSTFLRPGDSVLDVGAHVGTFTLAFARTVGDSGSVHAFEPQPAIFDLLTRNLNANQLAGRATAHNCAIGSANGYVRLPGLDYGQTGNFGAVQPKTYPGHPMEHGGIPLRKIDDLDLAAIRLIKIDVEGAELEAIDGAKASIKRFRPFISIEAHTIERAWQTVQVLRELELETWILATPAFNPGNFNGDSVDFFDLAYECAVLGAPREEQENIPAAARLGAIITPANSLDDVARAYVEIPLPGDVDFDRGSPRENLRRITREKQALSIALANIKNVLDDAASDAKMALADATSLEQSLVAERGRNAALHEERELAHTQAQSLRTELAGASKLLDETRDELRAASEAGDAVRNALAIESSANELHHAELRQKTAKIADLTNHLEAVVAKSAQINRSAEAMASAAQELASHPFRNLKNYLAYRAARIAANHFYLWPKKWIKKINKLLRKKNPKRFTRMLEDAALLLSGTRFGAAPRPEADSRSTDVMRAISAAGTFDATWYLTRYPDIEAAGVDPLRHYVDTGWHEGRDPSNWFSTSFYLTTNPDVAAAHVNPLWHYSVAGRREGRPCSHPGGVMAEIVFKLQPLRQQRELRHALSGDTDGKRLTGHELAQALRNEGLLLISLSQDDYRQSPGGIQLCIQIEHQAIRADLGGSILHLYPRIALPSLVADEDATAYEIIASLNGVTLGVISADGILSAFETLALDARLVIHSLLGHAPEFVAALYRASSARTALFWIHDYFAACSGYALMRNDVKYCGAPPPQSEACHVCIHGAERMAHLARMKKLFEDVPLAFVAPSEAAKRNWLAATGHRGDITVLPHCSLIAKGETEQPPTSLNQSLSTPARIAFLGHNKHFKGWTLFAKLASEFAEDTRYEFIQLGSRTEVAQKVTFEDVSIARDGPNAMISAIRKHRIDVAVTWSLWPETFGFVAYEALAAGAKIAVWDGAGNLADLARSQNAGLSLPDDDALRAAFADGTIHQLAMARRREEAIHRDIVFSRMSIDLMSTDRSADIWEKAASR